MTHTHTRGTTPEMSAHSTHRATSQRLRAASGAGSFAGLHPTAASARRAAAFSLAVAAAAAAPDESAGAASVSRRSGARLGGVRRAYRRAWGHRARPPSLCRNRASTRERVRAGCCSSSNRRGVRLLFFVNGPVGWTCARAAAREPQSNARSRTKTHDACTLQAMRAHVRRVSACSRTVTMAGSCGRPGSERRSRAVWSTLREGDGRRCTRSAARQLGALATGTERPRDFWHTEKR